MYTPREKAKRGQRRAASDEDDEAMERHMGEDQQHEHTHEIDHSQEMGQRHADEEEDARGADQKGPYRKSTEEQYAALIAHVDEQFYQLVAIVQQGLVSMPVLYDCLLALKGCFPPPPP